MDEIFINLRLLGRVGKHQKLITRDTYLNIEAKSMIPEGIRRWKRGDDRNCTIAKINTTVMAAIELMSTNAQIKTPLIESTIGIENLKETYSSCSQTCARLDTILAKIKSAVDTETF
jgi:hypothetical protein